MQLFCVKPTIHCFDTLREFLNAFPLGAEDLIFTETFLYRQYMEKETLSCRVLLKDDFGQGEPQEEVIDAILQEVTKVPVRRIIAVGGGSVIDIAKLLCVKDAFPVRRVMEGHIPPVTDKELIVLPTTCGTGSEVTFGGIVTMRDTGFKTGILAPELSATHAVLVPELLNTLPLQVFVHCSVDALGHAMESYISATRGNEMARAAGARAISLLMRGYETMALAGTDSRKKLLKEFLTASCLAGIAVNNGGAGPVHALGYPVGENFHVPHGETIRFFLTDVFTLYEERQDGALLEELRELIRPPLCRLGMDHGRPFENLEKLLDQLCPARRLRDYGMHQEDAALFAEHIFREKQRLLRASYAPFTQADAEMLYRKKL